MNADWQGPRNVQQLRVRLVIWWLHKRRHCASCGQRLNRKQMGVAIASRLDPMGIPYDIRRAPTCSVVCSNIWSQRYGLRRGLIEDVKEGDDGKGA